MAAQAGKTCSLDEFASGRLIRGLWPLESFGYTSSGSHDERI
jgi:hypothetical protein